MSAAESRDLVAYEEPQPYAQMLVPVVTPQEAREAIKAYEAMKAAIVLPKDIVKTSNGEFLRKSYWMRIARCFGLRVINVMEERLEIDGRVAYRVINRAIAPNGQSMDGDGFFIYGEKKETIEHNIRARAHTRATNRAISNLVAGGEVSAEEMPDIDDTDERPAPRPFPTRKPAPVKPQSSLADDMARLHTRALASGKVTTQEDWERELREAMHLGYNGDERTITREDFPRLVEHFSKLPAKTVDADLHALEVPTVRP